MGFSLETSTFIDSIVFFITSHLSPTEGKLQESQGCLLLPHQTPSVRNSTVHSRGLVTVCRMREMSYLKDTYMPTNMFSEMPSFLEEKPMFVPQAGGIETVLKSMCHINYGIGRK